MDEGQRAAVALLRDGRRRREVLNVGWALRGQVRNFLREMRFKGWDISWTEGEGFWSRPFYIEGDDKAVTCLERVVREFNKKD